MASSSSLDFPSKLGIPVVAAEDDEDDDDDEFAFTFEFEVDLGKEEDATEGCDSCASDVVDPEGDDLLLPPSFNGECDARCVGFADLGGILFGCVDGGTVRVTGVGAAVPLTTDDARIGFCDTGVGFPLMLKC